MITELDQAGIDLMIHFEGCILHPYRDQAGIPTIGIGMTYYPGTGKAVTMNDPSITNQQANDMFLDLSKPYANIVHMATVPVLNQNQFNALFSFTYNIGIGGFKGSTVLRLVNQYVINEQLKNAFLMWDKADGNVVQDLYNRRVGEYNLYVTA